MSLDIRLKHPVTGETLSVPGHVMIGGTYRAEYINGEFVPAVNTEAELNVTGNYSSYYRDAVSKDKNDGIHKLDGMPSVDSIEFLNMLINNIEKEYKDGNTWKTGTRERLYYTVDGVPGELDAMHYYDWCHMHPDLSEGAIESMSTRHIDQYTVSEGDTSDYWEKTAANALTPLYQLLALAKLRPDGVWEVSG